jgi:L-lactate permease
MLDSIIGLIFTAISYLFVPAILCFIGYRTNRSYSLNTIRKIMVINGGCLWIIFYAIQYYVYGETTPSVSAAVIWSGVAYWMMKKFLLEKEIKSENNEESENNEKIELEIVDKSKKVRSFKIPFIVMSVLLVLSLVMNLYQLGLSSGMEDSLSQSKKEQLDFLDEHVVMVEDDNTGWYHKYECHRFKGNDFWVYNAEAAESLGYEPCPFCCKG